MAIAELPVQPTTKAPIDRDCGRGPEPRRDAPAWSRGDATRACAWFLIALLLRAPLVARIEGVLDDDQSVVALMALDISQGARWPIYFDGQRYMSAIEAYTAAILVRLFGPGPVVVALAPTLYFGLFVALQYATWRSWRDRRTGHLAALIAAVGAPMLAVWSIAPRGGYTLVLAWASATLWGYRWLARPGAPTPSRTAQALWGFLLAVGYYVNPMALVVYAALALDWTFGVHGAELRRRHRLGTWLDAPGVGLLWLVLAVIGIAALAAGCHVRMNPTGEEALYVFALGALPPIFGVVWLLALLGFLAWWTAAPMRLARLIMRCPWGGAGACAALALPLLYHLRVALGIAPRDPSLPMWCRAPWAIGPNLRDGLRALACLLGCDPGEALFTLISHPTFQRPSPRWPSLELGLETLAPLVAFLAIGIIALTASRDRADWAALARLEGRAPGSPNRLMLLGLFVAAGLYLLQATSPDASSMRYLVVTWAFWPGLLASGLRLLSAPLRAFALAGLLVPWGLSQAALAADIDRPSPFRPLAASLEARSAPAIVAQAPIALLVANLTDGRVGAIQYQPGWPRLRDRYRDRFQSGQPVLCVVDPTYRGIPPEDLGRHLEELARDHPDKLVRLPRCDHYQLWSVDLPLEVVLKPPRGLVRLSAD